MNRYDLLGVGALTLFTAAAAYGCGDETAPNDNDGEGGSATSTSTTPIGPGPTGPATTTMTGGGGSMDEGTSCADAVPLEERANTLDGTFYDYSAIRVDHDRRHALSTRDGHPTGCAGHERILFVRHPRQPLAIAVNSVWEGPVLRAARAQRSTRRQSRVSAWLLSALCRARRRRR